MFESLVDPQANVSAGSLESVEHELALLWGNDRIETAVEEPNGCAAQGARVLARKHGRFKPPLWIVAPKNSARRDDDCRPATGVQPPELPSAVSAHGERYKIGTRRVAVKLSGLLVERVHGEFEHGGIGPMSSVRALRHDDHEGPAVGVVAHGFGN